MREPPEWDDCPIQPGDVVERYMSSRDKVLDIRRSGYPITHRSGETHIEWVWEYKIIDTEGRLRWYPFTRFCRVVIRDRIWL